jgi:hypothetical protein
MLASDALLIRLGDKTSALRVYSLKFRRYTIGGMIQEFSC